MPILIQNIKGEILTNITSNVRYVSVINGLIQKEDYINLNGFIGFTQNLSKTDETYGMNKPINFGLIDTYNKSNITLEISY